MTGAVVEPPPVRVADRWRLAGLVVGGVWAVVGVTAVVAFVWMLRADGAGPYGYGLLFGVPLVVVPAVLVVVGGAVAATRLVHRRPDAWIFHRVVGGFAVVAGAFYGLFPWGLLGLVCGGLTLLVARFGSRSWRRAATP